MQVGIKLRDPAALGFASKPEEEASPEAAEHLRIALAEIDALGVAGAKSLDTDAVASIDRRVKACRAMVLSRAPAKEKVSWWSTLERKMVYGSGFMGSFAVLAFLLERMMRLTCPIDMHTGTLCVAYNLWNLRNLCFSVLRNCR